MLLVFAAVLSGTQPVAAWQQQDPSPEATQVQPEASETNQDFWRRTRFGWEDTRDWDPVTSLRPEAIPGMHPLAWSAVLVLSVLCLALWAAGEDELGRMAPWLVAHPERGLLKGEPEALADQADSATN